MSPRWLLLVLTSACAPGGAVLTDHAPSDTAPAVSTDPSAPPVNVLVVVLDDLGIDKVRAWHPDAPNLPPQPTLDRLSQEGLRFTTAWAQPVCSPTRAALLTGLHARRVGIGDWLPIGATAELLPEVQTLPERVRATRPEVSTAAFGKWHLSGIGSPSGPGHPNVQGFDHYAGWLSNVGSPFTYQRYRWVEDGALSVRDGYLTTETVDAALDWVAQAPEPWLAYVATHAVHDPVHLPPAALHDRDDLDPATAAVPELYEAMVQSLDRELGRLLDGIPPEVRDRTHIVVVGDNGTYRSAILPPFDPNRGKGMPFEGGVRVPLWVLGPAVEPGTVTDALAHVADLTPTVLSLLGVDPPDGLDGVDLTPVLHDPSAEGGHEVLYADRFGPPGPGPYTEHDWRVVRDRTHRLIADERTGHELLFRLDGAPLDDGWPVLPSAWTAADTAAAERLGAELDRLRSTLQFVQ